MRLETERLILRGKQEKDAKDLVEGINNLNISKWLLVVPYPYTMKDAKDWLSKKKKEDYTFMIVLKKEKKVIGAISFHKVDTFQGTTTIGYWLNEKYHRQGYGSEALAAMLKLAFEKLKLRKVEAAVFVGNPASGKLLEKFGAQQEGLKRKSVRCKADGKIRDEIIYGILKEDWKKAIKK